MTRATGIGSWPGSDLAEAVKIVLGELVVLPHLPELPARGPHASMIGRTLGLVDDLGADLQPDGWRVGVGEGVDQRRARSLLAQDLDVVEELTQELTGRFKVQVTGPVTLAATVEHPRGEKVLADHGARRELAEAHALAVARRVADVRRRIPGAELVVQVDEPALHAVLDGRVPTASGYRTLRSLDAPEVDALLRPLADVIRDGGATPVVHTCAQGVPVDLLRGARFGAISFDLAHAGPDDVWAEALDAGIELWIGTVPSTDPSVPVSGADVADRVLRFLGALGFTSGAVRDQIVITPTCGLVGASPAWARRALTVCTEAARRCDDAWT